VSFNLGRIKKQGGKIVNNHYQFSLKGIDVCNSKKYLILVLTVGILLGANTPYSMAEKANVDPPPSITSVDTLLFEDFSGPEGPFALNPLPGWTVIDSGVPEWDETSWSRYENISYPQYWNGDLCRVIFSGTNSIGDWLISPMFDCTNELAVSMSFKHRHQNRSSSDNDTAFVYGSTDGGQNWDHLLYMATQSVGALNAPDTVEIDITSWAAGYDSVRIAFYLKGNDVLTWYLDEPFVGGTVTDTLVYEDFNGFWGPFGNLPPQGWEIINEVIPDPPNINDWSRWYYSTWPDNVACAYDNFNDETANEWLITPALSFSETAICSLSFYNSYWDDSSDPSDSAFVLGSTNGGLTWDYPIVLYTIIDDRSTIKANSWRGFDISSWAQNHDDVKIAFHYLKDEPSYLGWWFFDDLLITQTTITLDNVAAISLDYPSELVVVGDDYFPQVTLHNLSLDQQTVDLNLTVLDAGNTEVYNYTETGIVLDSVEIAQVTLNLPFTPLTPGDHSFTAAVINPGDENPADDTVRAVLPCYEHVGSGGPDAFGYRFIDNTMPNGPTFDWIEISNSGTQIEPGLHYFMSQEIPLGFSMEFYGSTYSSIWVNSHGEIHIGSRDTWLSTNDCPLPDPSTPNAPLLAVFWDRLYIHYEIGAGVYCQYFDNGNNDYMVVEWQAKIYDANSDSVVFEAVLYQDGEIVYQYNYVNEGDGGQGQEATIGIEYDQIPSGLSYNCNDANPANRLQNGLAIKWYLEPISVEDSPELPLNYVLSQNYPNPFNARTTLSYSIPRGSQVKLEVTDVLGRVVDILVDDYRPAGVHEVVWDAADKSSGVYFYRIKSGTFSQAKKMILLK